MNNFRVKKMFRTAYEKLLFNNDNIPAPFKHTNTVFIHIPKAAGTSLCLAIYGVQVGHRAIKEYVASNKGFCESATKFAICRDPVARCFSAYNFLKSGGMTRTDQDWSEKHLSKYDSFEDFVLNGLHRNDVLSYIHFIPQHKYIEKYHLGPSGVDLIVKLENLEKDWFKINALFESDIKLAHLNKTKYSGSERKIEFSEEINNKIREVYSRDYWLLGY
ncbi:MAG: sulfotransferase family 2 domain-containing protein [Gammaproteobacteria bacterium]|nr:sulfotransferase family 2 domain-containing protein [Gammaproteobacteria bacterium]